MADKDMTNENLNEDTNVSTSPSEEETSTTSEENCEETTPVTSDAPMTEVYEDSTPSTRRRRKRHDNSDTESSPENEEEKTDICADPSEIKEGDIVRIIPRVGAYADGTRIPERDRCMSLKVKSVGSHIVELDTTPPNKIFKRYLTKVGVSK